MVTPRRPATFERSLDTPPATPASMSADDSKTPSTHIATTIPTPPTSPRAIRKSANDSNNDTSISTPQALSSASPFQQRGGALQRIKTDLPQNHTPPTVFLVPRCPFEVEILKDARGRDAIFGTGAWSIVYKATTRPKSHQSTSESLTPPQSPTVSTPELVAVKKPNRGDATIILRNEAKVLAYLHSMPDSERYIVPFCGIMEEATLVLQAIPFSLEGHIRKCAFAASRNFSTRTMNEPVVGSTAIWLQLAHRLVSALTWLHCVAGVVHGDIKPGNILLSNMQGDEAGQSQNQINGNDVKLTFDPLFADFSSAQLINAQEPTSNTLSAVTREYTAPELLKASVLRDPESTATTASDVFSLAVTLLVAATGQLLVYPGSVFQRQLMATQGWMVLDHVRNGDQGSRVPRNGVVQKVLEQAVRKVDAGRVGALQWLDIVEKVISAESTKL
ncbi:hypothetical protein ABEF93_007156 [Exophiala dermatitidis]